MGSKLHPRLTTLKTVKASLQRIFQMCYATVARSSIRMWTVTPGEPFAEPRRRVRSAEIPDLPPAYSKERTALHRRQQAPNRANPIPDYWGVRVVPGSNSAPA